MFLLGSQFFSDYTTVYNSIPLKIISEGVYLQLLKWSVNCVGISTCRFSLYSFLIPSEYSGNHMREAFQRKCILLERAMSCIKQLNKGVLRTTLNSYQIKPILCGKTVTKKIKNHFSNITFISKILHFTKPCISVPGSKSYILKYW